MSRPDPSSQEIVGLYQRHADWWLEVRSDALPERVWLDRFCALLPAQAFVLDMGCGSGRPMSMHLSSLGHDVTGVDASPALIAAFRSNLPGQTGVIGDMRSVEIDRRFDGVLAWNSFFHLTPDDQRAMFPRFSRLSRPGAALMFTSGPAAGEAFGEVRGEKLYHASLESGEYAQRLEENGFDIIKHVVSDTDCGGLTVWLARRK